MATTKPYTPPLDAAEQVIETTAAIWWPTNDPTRCISCNAKLPPNYQAGQELACGH